jgi:hypothetical protein
MVAVCTVGWALVVDPDGCRLVPMSSTYRFVPIERPHAEAFRKEAVTPR